MNSIRILGGADNRFSGPILLGMFVVITLSIRFLALSGKSIPTHDETVSYIAATVHQGEYVRTVLNRLEPYGQWTTCSSWRRFIATDRPFQFSLINRDLLQTDLHPPFYFWLLHLACLVLGTGLMTGLALNAIIAAFSCIVLWHLARQLLSGRQLMWAMAFWCCSPAVWSISLEARPYDLLALTGLLFVWQSIVILWADDFRLNRLVVLFLIVLAGALTHYHFLLLATGGLVLASRRRWCGNWRKGLCYQAVVLIACSVSFLVHPGLILALQRQRQETMAGGLERLAHVVDRSVLALSSFVSNIHLVQYALFFLAIFAMVLIWRRSKRAGAPRTERSAFGDMEFFCIWLVGMTMLLYLTGISPGHAMGGKYLAAVWPLLAMVVVKRTDGGRTWLHGFLLLSMLVSSAISLASPAGARQAGEVRKIFNDCDGVVVDTAARGELLRLLWLAPDDKPVLAAMQRDLLSDEAWTRQLNCRVILVSRLTLGNSQMGQERLRQRWPQACLLQPVMKVNKYPGKIFRAVVR